MKKSKQLSNITKKILCGKKMNKVSDVIAEFLKELDIKIVFGIIGSANSHIFDSITKLGFTKIVFLHHEQACVMAMGAHFRASGKLSAALVTAGGGATNAVTGIVSNWADSIPGFIICGQESSNYCKIHSNLRMYGTQGLDIVHMTSKVVKYGVRVDDCSEIQNHLSKAYFETINGRPGPVLIDIPFDVQSKLVSIKAWNFDKKEVIASNYNSTYEIIKNSKRPVIVCGNGVRLSNAHSLFKKFIEKNSLPTLLTWSAIDVIDNYHQLHFGRFGLYGQRAANFIVQNADVVVVLGSRLALPQAGYDFSQFAREAKIIVVDIDESEIEKYSTFYTETHIQSCDTFLENIINFEAIEPKDDWIDYCNNLKEKYPLVDKSFTKDNYVNSYSFIDKLSEKLADNHIIVTDMGTALLSGHQTIMLKENQTMFTSLGLGEMGYGLPGAIGAAFACPEKPVLCLNCDGGIMMNLQEAHSIIDNKLNVKIIIFNNDGYLMIKHTQKMLFQGKFVGVNAQTGVGLPNFNLLMTAFGYKHFELRSMEDFDKTMEDFLSFDQPSVLEVFMNPEQDFIPKVKGVSKNDGSIFAPSLEEMSPIISFEELKENMIVNISEKSKQIVR
jgi:acetolactate synthase-1/2/3 large subunit